jgi:hypothetical protein
MKDVMEVREFAKLKEIVSDLPQSICIEGFTNSGKSYLASQLSVFPPRCVLRTDAFARQRHYDENFADLVDKTAFERSLAALPSGTVIEGVLLRHFVPAKLWSSMFWIYVKVHSQADLWHDGFTLEDPRPDNWLDAELWDYHSAYEPHKCADVIYIRPETLRA